MLYLVLQDFNDGTQNIKKGTVIEIETSVRGLLNRGIIRPLRQAEIEGCPADEPQHYVQPADTAETSPIFSRLSDSPEYYRPDAELERAQELADYEVQTAEYAIASAGRPVAQIEMTEQLTSLVDDANEVKTKSRRRKG